MKRSSCIAAALAAVSGWSLLPGPAIAQDRPTRVVVVHLERVFNEYFKTRRADAQLKAQAEEFGRERQTLIEELEQAQQAFTALREESQNPALTEEARALRRGEAEDRLLEIREQESRIRQFEELRSKQLEDQSRRMRRGLVEEIRDAIQSYARNQGYDLVLDASGNSLNGVELILYADARVDITSAVIEQLNRGAPEAPPERADP